MGLDLDVYTKKNVCSCCGRGDGEYLAEDIIMNGFSEFIEDVLKVNDANCTEVEVPEQNIGDLIKFLANRVYGEKLIEKIKAVHYDIQNGENVKLFVKAYW